MLSNAATPISENNIFCGTFSAGAEGEDGVEPVSPEVLRADGDASEEGNCKPGH